MSPQDPRIKEAEALLKSLVKALNEKRKDTQQNPQGIGSDMARAKETIRNKPTAPVVLSTERAAWKQRGERRVGPGERRTAAAAARGEDEHEDAQQEPD